MSPTEKANIEWQLQQAKKVQLYFLSSWRHTAWKWKKSFPPWLFDIGQKSMDKKMESRAKGSLDEADSGGPNVETGERASRSSGVPDP